MLIKEVVTSKGTKDTLKQKEFIIKEILESEEVSHSSVNPDYTILYEKVEWKKIILLKETYTVVENKVKTEEFIKVIKADKNSSSSKCLKVYLLNDEQTMDSVIRKIQNLY